MVIGMAVRLHAGARTLNISGRMPLLNPIAAALLLCTTLACVAGEPLLKDRLLFPLQPKHVHSSCIVECPNGDLLACWFQGSGERTATDVAIMGARLRHGAQDWSASFLMA